MDTLKIISDLGLEEYVFKFLNTGNFPSKYVWKKQVRLKVDMVVKETFLSETEHEHINHFLSVNTVMCPCLFLVAMSCLQHESPL